MTEVLVSVGGIALVLLLGMSISAHLCDIVEAAVRAHAAGLRAYRWTVRESWRKTE